MTGPKLIGLGLILLCGLPALIAATEGRRVPALLQLPLAIMALVWWWFTDGLAALALSLAAGTLVFMILVTALAFTQKRWGRRLLAGDEIKMMAAAALWLAPFTAVATMLTAVIAAIAWTLIRRLSKDKFSRPDFAPFVITALLATFAVT